ncbi:MAG: response regulator [Verrucomicrobiales bacterium]|nr:response regulator [Verrucomicrobiales bacterium]
MNTRPEIPSVKSTILVVDDHPTNLKLITELLSFEGYTVCGAVDAESALELLTKMTPELILMDIALPGMDGLTLTRKLKAEVLRVPVFIVALTAFAMKGDEQKALDAGCDAYISKPIDTRRILPQIAEFIEQTWRRRQQLC